MFYLCCLLTSTHLTWQGEDSENLQVYCRYSTDSPKQSAIRDQWCEGSKASAGETSQAQLVGREKEQPNPTFQPSEVAR
ncbi:hypothetical protein GQ55_2G329000 [Panicum hallii var. hallii]|uniref:Secreted protein n=2 Tax=Panicum hallii TaxID=206008 RepID=A0A2T7EUX9_9POAL|nr:hypothetical protein GQ55_2G329000 [Panicum hallii var. hallii]PVH64707.1 hypothetical protein PAHAL_2G339000 [Panicum hallii]